MRKKREYIETDKKMAGAPGEKSCISIKKPRFEYYKKKKRI